MSRVKIVATIGPKTNSPEAIRSLVQAGMDVARLNGSHADLQWHAETIEHVRRISPSVPILLDIPGSKIRTCQLQYEPVFQVGEKLIFTTEKGCDARTKIPVTSDTLPRMLQSGSVIVADDGALRFIVEEIRGNDVICRAERGGTLRSGKGIHITTTMPRIEILSEKDRSVLSFAKEQGIDFVGVSFVEGAEQVRRVRDFLGSSSPRIISKIESQRGMDGLEEIANISDAMMVDRGDLSVETQLESIAIFQKRILNVARGLAKPVIVATEMLHSMMRNPFPTKAEVTDISNAVLDGAAAIMLSGETAVGDYPVESVTAMRRIADRAAEHLQEEWDRDNTTGADRVPEATADAVALLCRRLPITKIIAVTISGYAAQMVAARRPRQPILAVSNNAANARSFNLLPGTEGVYVAVPFLRTSTEHVVACLEELWRCGKIVEHDVILVTAVGYPRSGNRMNLIQAHHVADLKKILKWH